MGVLAGVRTGQMGLFVSQAGADATTANEFDLLFSSNFARLKLIGAGSVSLNRPTVNGDGFQGASPTAATTNVPWPDGKTYTSHLPFVVAASMATDYTLHLIGSDSSKAVISQAASLNGVYITNVGVIDPDVLFNFGIKMNRGNGSNFFPGQDFWMLGFDVRPNPSFCQFATNNDASPVTVKYLFYDPFPAASS